MTNPWGLETLEHDGLTYELQHRIEETKEDYVSLLAAGNG
jgi:hypothetical protein